MNNILDALDIGDLETLEDHGLDIDALSNMTTPSARQLVPLIYVLQRKAQPDLTIEQVRAIRLSQLPEMLSGLMGDDADPELPGHVNSVPKTELTSSPGLSSPLA